MASFRRSFPPPLVFLSCIVSMFVLSTIWPIQELGLGSTRFMGLLVVVAGLTLNVPSARRFAARGTNIIPANDPELLVTDGWFRWSRNPMYLGFTVSLVGAAILRNTLVAFLGPVVFVLVIRTVFIAFEEQRMEAVFGDRYTEYCSSVRRWLTIPPANRSDP